MKLTDSYDDLLIDFIGNFFSTLIRHERAVTYIIRVLLSVIILLILLYTLQEFPHWQVEKFGITNPKDLAEMENTYRVTLVQILGGIAFGTGLYFTWKKLLISQDGQITERFTRAVDQLGALDQNGNPAIEIRLGGIYALERISKESDEDYWPIMEILTAYVRKNSPVKNKLIENNLEIKPISMDIQANEITKKDNPDVNKVSLDVQAVLTVITRRNWFFNTGESIGLDLQRTHLIMANLEASHFEKTNFEAANLYRADLGWANLEEANLEEANLEEANLGWANLVNANLYRADLVNANLEEANLVNANLERANLVNANLERANLVNTNLERANLERANLSDAKLSKAEFYRTKFSDAKLSKTEYRTNFSDAKLSGANLRRANLELAYLGGADFTDAHLEEANLEWAYLGGADFTAANLTAANLEGAYLGEANLEKACLGKANLTAANLTAANLIRAKYLTIDQLSKVKTLYKAKLDEELRKQLEDKYPDKYQELTKKTDYYS